MRYLWAILFICLTALGAAAAPARRFVPLFPESGTPKGWIVGEWYDVGVPVPDARWTVEDGVLKSVGRGGSWLLSEREYGDFVLELEIKMTESGNSGVALRAPAKGDPAFDGLELQFMDPRYDPRVGADKLTGSLYAARAPIRQVYRPTEWNRCRIELKGSRLKVVINDAVVQDVDLNTLTEPQKRHNGMAAPSLKDRPRRGRIGFQHGGGEVLIRGARIRELK